MGLIADEGRFGTKGPSLCLFQYQCNDYVPEYILHSHEHHLGVIELLFKHVRSNRNTELEYRSAYHVDIKAVDHESSTKYAKEPNREAKPHFAPTTTWNFLLSGG
jgi:hypothetical protein